MTTSLIPLATFILRPLLPSSFFVLSGIALSLSAWIVPLWLLPSTPSRVITNQFTEVIRRGYMYLQSGSRCLAIALLATTILTYYHGDKQVASTWVWYAAATFTLVQVAWYEAVFIFPINDQIIATGDKLEGEDLWLEEREHAKLHELIRSWRRWHFGRILAPFIAGCLTLIALL